MIIGSELLRYEKVSSTNSVAADLLKSGNAKDGTVIVASWQEAGRGQQGNTWESDPGKNLLFSIILFPSIIRPDQQFYICQVISLGVYDALKNIIPSVSIKWPNDIYVSNDKIAGILIENSIFGNSIDSTVAGIGLNVNQDVFHSNAPNPVSIKILTGKESDTEKLLSDICLCTDLRYKMLLSGREKVLSADYKASLFRLNQWHKFRDTDGTFEGCITDVRESGLLVIRKKNGTMAEYAFKEVAYVL